MSSNDKMINWDQWCMFCNDGGELICCETCHHVSHGDCLDQSIESDEDWYCPSCLKKKKKQNLIK